MNAIDRRLQLSLLPERFAIARLAADAAIPSWATRGAFFSITRTADELSVVTSARNVPDGVSKQDDWRALKVHGPFALSEIGVLSVLTVPLAGAKISVFVISTFDTDYLLVHAEQLRAAMVTLERAGHELHQREFDY